MTCEIAVMNREAVALAADSAETVGRKIFRSAEKLFALSRAAGIMIYGATTLAGVPWETVIKRYRNELGDTRYETLKEYGDSFIKFIEENENRLIPESTQKKYMLDSIHDCFDSLVEDIDTAVKVLFYRKKNVTESNIVRVAEGVVGRYCQAVNSFEMYPSIPQDYAQQISRVYKADIDNLIEEIFEQFPTASIKEELEEIAIGLFTHNIRESDSCGIDYFDEYEPRNSSGIVIAGFGETDAFPSVAAYDIEGMLLNHLKYMRLDDKSSSIAELIDEDAPYPARIIPFAQEDMVDQVVYGVDSTFDFFLIRESVDIFSSTYSKMIGNDRKLRNDDKERLLKKLISKRRQVSEGITNKALEFEFRTHYLPTLRVLSVLPKDELAVMAETLVNLTSFKRRITMASETVAGPVDVAIISRGDGFIWTKRKRYFPPELNPNCND